MEERLLSIREVSQILSITEKEVIELAESGKLPAYKIGGVYLRFKQAQVDDFKKSAKSQEPAAGHSSEGKDTFGDSLRDFFYFNDFYIFSIALIVLILIVIFRGY
jgi:excisionase family DNA binding protein